MARILLILLLGTLIATNSMDGKLLIISILAFSVIVATRRRPRTTR